MWGMRWWPCVCLLIAGCPGGAQEPATDAGTLSEPQDAATDAAVVDAATPNHDAAPPEDPACEPLAAARTVMVLELQAGQRAALRGNPGSSNPETYRLDGVVIAHGQGFPAADAPANLAPPTDPDALSFLRIQGADRTWTVIVRDVSGFGVSDGTQVSVHFSAGGGGFAPELNTLSVSAASELAFHYASGGAVQQLGLPDGWHVSQGDALCERTESCGKWSGYDVRVTPPAGVEAVLRAGEVKHLAGYSVSSSSAQQLPSTGSGCADWYVSSSELLLVRDVPAAGSCNVQAHSTLPGVEIRFDPGVKCRFSLPEARAGIRIPYQVVVARDVPEVSLDALDDGGCMVRAPGELAVFEEISGGEQYYGLKDVGNCPRMDGPVGTLSAGVVRHEFVWDGLNWRGPSDTGEVKGAAFPVGVYGLRIRAVGDVRGVDFEVVGELEVVLGE